jgi:Ca2+-binding RTX toxin-like protein
MFSRKSPGMFGHRRNGSDKSKSRERRTLRQIAPRKTHLEWLEERVVLDHGALDPANQNVIVADGLALARAEFARTWTDADLKNRVLGRDDLLAAGAPAAAGAPDAGNLTTSLDHYVVARYGDVTRIDLRELIELAWDVSLDDDPLLGYYEYDITLPFLSGSVATDGNGNTVANYLSDDNELFVDRGTLYYLPQIITPSNNPGALATGATSDIASYDVRFIDATDNSVETVFTGDLNVSIDLAPQNGYSSVGDAIATFGSSRMETYRIQQRLRYLGYFDAIGNAANLLATTGDLDAQTKHAIGVFNAAAADTSVDENSTTPNISINSEAAARWVPVTYGPGITNAGSNEDYMTHLAKAALLAADANTTNVLPFIGATTKGGGDTPGHASHEAGMDIDIDTVGTNSGSTPFYKTNTIGASAYVAAKATGDAAANNHIAQLVGINYVAKRFRGSVTGATNANPIVITSNGHGLANGEQVTISGVVGNTTANGTFTVSNVTANTFRLVGAVGNGAYTSGGTWIMAAAPTGAVAHVVGASSTDAAATVNQQSLLTGIKDLIVDGPGYSLTTEQAKIDAFRTQDTTAIASVYYNDPRTWTTTGVPVQFSSGHGGHFHVNIQKPALVTGDEQRGLLGGLGAFFQNLLPDLTADDPSASASPPAGSPAASPAAGNLNILGLAEIPFVQENFGELIDIVQLFDDLQTRLVQKANVEGQGPASNAAIPTTPFFVIFDGGTPHEVIVDAGTYANTTAWLNELNNDALASVPYLGVLNLGDFLIAKDDDNDGRIEFETANEGFTQSLTITTLRLTAGSAAAANGQLAADATFTLDIERETGTTPYVVEIQVATPTEAEEEAAAPYNVPNTNDNYNLDTLLDDVNDALLLAGVYDVIAVKDPAGTRIALAATDPTITKITVNNIADDAALGFANGASATEAYDEDTATPPSSPLGFAGIRDVPDLKYPTINDLVDNLASELAAISDGPLPGGFDVDSEYDPDLDTLFFNIALNKTFTKTIDLNFDEGFDLGILGTLEIISDATAEFNASVELSFRAGIYLGALGDSFVLDNTSLLADINAGDGVPLDVGILATNSVPGPQGKVSPDVSFNLAINGMVPIAVTLDDAATTTNYDIAALAADLNAALAAIATSAFVDPDIANLDDVVRFSVDSATNKLALRGVHPEVYSVGISNISNLSDLGFTGAESPNRPDFVITIDPLGTPINYNIDLDGANDIGDVITKIQAAAPVTVTINADKGLTITSNTADEIDISATATSTALGIAGSSLGTDTIIGQPLHGESSVDRIFIVESDPSETNLTIDATFETNGLDLSAGLGFLSFDITATDELELGASLGVRLTDPSASPNGFITLQEILETTDISDLVDLDTPTFVADGTLAVSSPMLLAIGDSSAIASLDIGLSDPTDITSITFDFTTNEDAFAGLKDLSIADVLDIVHNVVDLLLENNDIPWLNQPIPLVDASLSDALGFLDDLLDKIDEIASKIDPDELNAMLDQVETAIGDLNVPFIDKDVLFSALNKLRAVINEIDLGSFSEESPSNSPSASPASGPLDIGDINRLPGRLLAATANARKAIEAVPNSAPGKQELLDALDAFEALVPDLEKLEQRVEDAISDALESAFPGLNVTTKLDFVDYNCNTATVENALIVGITLDGSDYVNLGFEPDLDVPDLGPVEIQLGADLNLRAGGVLNLGFGAMFDTSAFVPFVIAGADQPSCGYTDHVQTELNLNAGFAGAASADVRFGQLDLLEGDIDMSLVKGNEDHVTVVGASGNRHVVLSAAPWNADPRLVIVQVGSETSPRPAEDFSITGTTLLFASNVQPAAGTPVVVSYRTGAAPNVNPVANRASLDVTFSQTPSDGNTLGAIPLGTFLSNFGSSLDLDVQGILTGTVDVEFLNSTAEDAVTLAIGLEDPLDPQFHYDAAAIEDMFANIDFDLTLVCQGVESLLDTLEAGLTSEIAQKLPLVGGALDTTGTFLGKLREDFVTPICDFLEDVGGSLEDVAAFIRQEVFDLLGPSGIDLLADRPEDANSSIGLTDVIVNLTTDNFEIIVTLAGSDETTVDFDTNVAGLPIEVQASGGVRVGWDYKIDLGIGIDRANGFYFVLNDEDDMNNTDGDFDDPEFQFNLDIGLAVDHSGSEPIPTSFGINLFGLELSATDILNDDGTRGTGIGGLLTLDVAVGGPDDPDGYRRLYVSDIDDKPFHEIFTAKLDTTAEINLELAAEIDANLPSIRTDLMVSFGVEVSTGPSGVDVDFDTPSLQFKDIRLDLGDFLSKHIGKILKDVDGFIDPIKPVVKFLLTEVPGLSQLSELAGRGKVTFLDLAFIKNPEQGETAKRFIGILDQIISLIDTLANFGPGENVSINFGTVTIDASNGFSFDNNLWAENFSATNYLDDNPSFGASVVNDINTLNQTVASVFNQAEREADPEGEDGLGISFDIIKPANIIKLLLGQRANIVTWNIPRFDVGLSLEMSFRPIPIVYPFKVTVGFDFGAFADLSVGYDTRGILETHNFFDGFFFGDRANVDSGEDIPELGFLVGARLRAELDLLVASAGIEGALVATIDANWRDVDNDGKMYLDEIAQVVKQDGLLCLFDITGELRAIIRLVWSIFGAEDSKDIINVLIFKFMNECPKFEVAHVTEGSETLPDGTNVPAGTLVLHSGSLAGERQPGSSSDVAETFTLTQLGDGVISIEGMGFTQRYGGVLQIYADGGKGNDRIELVDVTLDSTIHGGEGNDTITSGIGDDFITGGAGHDIITTKNGADTIDAGTGNDLIDSAEGADSIAAGGGKDTITSGDGADTITGGDDDDSIVSGQGADSIDAGGGADYIDAGTENDTILGGAGDDTIYGMNGADSITGDGGKDYIEGGAGADTIEGGAQNDTIYGQGAADSIDGGPGRDYLEGNDANDTILGGSGHDTLLGQAGNDSMRGGSGHDSMVGDVGADIMVGDADNDLIIGNEDLDELFGGFGNDVIYSYIPGNTADPVNMGHHVEGNPDDDFICGTQASDDIWGGTHDDGYTAYWTQWTEDGYPTVLSGGFTPVGCTSGGDVTFDDPGVGTIGGTKFRDSDGDGIRDDDEPGLAGWTIQILDDEGEIVDEFETDSDGNYEFTDLDGGTYTLVEVMQDNWVQTAPAGGSHLVTVDGGQTIGGKDFGNFELATVSGFKWSDKDKDGLHDEGEPGLANVFIWADADDDNVWDPGVEQFTFSVADDPTTEDIDETGNFTIGNLYPGDYIIREIVPSGYVRTYPIRNVLNLDKFESVTVSTDWSSDSPDHPGRLDIDRTPQNNRGFLGPFGDETVTLDLDNLPAHTLLNISFDLFVIGSWNGNAAGPNGPDRFQFRVDGGTHLDTTFSNTATNQAFPGAFAIGNFAAKTNANESNTLGYGLTGVPASQPPANPADAVYRLSFTVPHVANTLSLDFEAMLASIDFEQWGIDNVTVSFPIDGHSVSLGSGDAIEGIDFGNYAIPGEIHGTKFDDLNGNGTRGTNEPGIGGVTVYLDLDNDGTFDSNEPWMKTTSGVQGDIDNDGIVGLGDLAILQANFGSCDVGMEQGDLNADGCVTQADVAIVAQFYGNSTSNPIFPKGQYWFKNLEPGNYTVREIVPAGYVQTAPAAGSHNVAISPGSVINNQNFGNTKGGEIHGTKWHDANRNGQRETTEPGIAGVTIYADMNNNGQLDPGEPSAVTMADDPNTTADETGAYWLKGVKPGTVVIREIVPDGCRQTFPTVGFYSINVVASQPIQNANFGNVCEGEIHGEKWLDRDADRQRDPGEPGLPAVTIYLDLNNNGQLDAGEPTTMTRKDVPTTPINEDGLYSFVRVPIGTYVVREVVPQGTTQTYPVAGGHVVTVTAKGTGRTTGHIANIVFDVNFGNTSDGGEIHGTKWNDLNRNGQRDTTANGLEPGVPGVTVYIDRDNDGIFDSGEPSTVTMLDNPATTADEAGVYWFTNVPAGTWVIREVLPANSVQTFPANNQGHTVRLDPRQTERGRDFGNSQNQGGTVTGTKWDDVNMDGRRDTAPVPENGVPGITIFLDANGNGQLDAGEPTTTTLADNPATPANEAGTYVFTNVPPGTYTVLEVLPNGYVQTFPANNGGHTITVVAGQTIGGRDFGNTRDQSGTVTGTKWDDLNGNGQRDSGAVTSGPSTIEPGVAGVRIYSDVNGNGQFDSGEPNTLTMADDPTTPLDETGRYVLTGLQPGVHVIREDLPASNVQTFPGNNSGHTVTVATNQTVSGRNFGNYKEGEIHGTKWNDLDSNGRRDSGEPGIAGVVIYIDVNGDGSFQTTEPSTTTMADNPSTPANEAGQYWFMHLAPGMYRVREVVPTGMTQTFPPATNPHDITIQSGDIKTDVDFGNHVDQTPIRFTNFSDAGNFIRMNNNASITQSRLRLTNNGTNQRGSAFLAQKVQFTGDFTFSTHFAFEISLPGGTSDVDGAGGHGLTFVMHNAPAGLAAIGTVGGGMGLAGITPAVAVEFDTFHTGAFDPATNNGTNGSHIGIDVSSIATSVAQTAALPRFNDGGVRHAWIDYDGFGDMMRVYLSTTATKPAVPTLTFAINLTGPTDLFVGFTAATDAAFNRHEILAWEMSVGGVPLSPPAEGAPGSDAMSFSFDTGTPTPAAAPPASTIVIPAGSTWKYLDDGSNQGTAWRQPAFNDAAWPGGNAQFGYGEGDEATIINAVGPNGKIATHYFRKTFTLLPMEFGNFACLGVLRDDGAVVYLNGVELGRTNMPAGVISFNTLASGPAADDGQVFQMFQVNAGMLTFGTNVIAVELHQALNAADNDASFDAFLYAEPCGGNIHGFKWRDLDNDGQRDPNEPGLAGVTIYVDVNLNGQYDPAIDRDAVTKSDNPATPNVDETGMYWIQNVPAGTWRVREVVPSGHTQTYPQNGFHTVGLEETQTVSNVDFGNRPHTNPQTGEVHGTKFFDLNWNRQKDANESGIANVTIYADLNNNGQLDTGEPSTQTMADNPQTPNVDETGMYWLPNLPPTTVVIREVIPQGFIQTAPLGGFYTVALTPGAIVVGRDFGNSTRGESGEVYGNKYRDANGNGKRDPGEGGIAGVTIYSDVNGNGQLDPGEPSTVTKSDNPATPGNEEGTYELNLGPGQHMICEVVPVNMVQTFPTTNDGCWPLTVGPGTVAEGFDFGNQPSTIRRGEIHGMKWDDYDNALGSHDAYEPGVAGITIYLDLNNDGDLDPGEPSTVTNATGNYSFTMLPAGTYHVREVLPEGYAQSFPGTPDHTINLGGGQIVTGVDFGNFKYILIPDGKDEIYGSNGADTLLGDNEVSDPRTLSIGDDDTMFGEQGQDTLDGQDKNDSLWGGEQQDLIIGGIETDEADRVLQEVDNNQVLTDGLLTGQGNDTLVNIEHATLIGGASANTLDADMFTRGSVILIGNGGNDSLYGTAFDDELFGNGGDDLLDALNGNDSLTGGEGSDNLMGGNGDETYIFTTAAAPQNDTINEPALATAGLDTLDFTALGPTDPATVNLTTGTGGHTNRTLTFVNGQYIEVLLGGAGNDVFTGHAGANNRIEGNGGNDTLSGVGGLNTIVGGAGNDAMTGGTSDDLYLFAAGFGTDTVTDPGGANDTLDLSAMTSAITGNISAASASFTDGANTVTVTNNLVERILSGSGSDTFNFLAGATLAGGAGSIDANAGVDHLNYSAYVTGVTVNLTTSTATGTAGVFDFENVTGGSGGDHITGSGGANVLSGLGGQDSLFGQGGADHLFGFQGNDPQLDGGAGNDTIEGGEGSDGMIGGLGDDTYIFAAVPGITPETDTITEATSPSGGNDTLDFTFLTNPLTANLPSNVATHTLRTVNFANPTSIETILSGSGNDTLTGDAGDNLFISVGGNDLLTSGGGNDTLVGGNDNDTYRIALNAAGDTVEVDERPGGGTDALDFSVTTGAGAFVRVNIGTAGLDATPGLIAKHGVDATRQVTTAEDDLAINFENITGSGGSDVIFGSAVANSITGGAGNDELHGGDGNDTLNGGLGSDSLYGDKHDDRLIGGAGTNMLDGGTHHDRYVFTQGSAATDTLREDPSQVSGGLTIIGGDDILDFSAFTIAVTVDLSNTGPQSPATGLSFSMQRVNGSPNSDHFETVLGSATAVNNLTGNAFANSLVGGSANDTLNGGAGNDTLTGNAGNDRLFGQAGQDTLIFDTADITSVDGGTESDTLLFTGAASLNLATAAQLNDIDVIDVAGTASTVSGTPTGITNVTDSGTVLIKGGAAANVSLTGGWTLFINGSTTNTYQDVTLTKFAVVEDDVPQAASSPPAPSAVVVAVRDRAVAAIQSQARQELAIGRAARAIGRPSSGAVDGAFGSENGTGSQVDASDLSANRSLRGKHRARIAADVLFSKGR